MTAAIVAAGLLLIAGRYARRLHRIHQAHRAYETAMAHIQHREAQAAMDLADCRAIWALPATERTTP